MLTLYLETSTRVASLALSRDDRIIAEQSWDAVQGSAAGLTVRLDQLLSSVQEKPANLEQVVVSRGPGSFTGLRVGITTAKTLGFALGIPLLGLNSLQVAGWPCIALAEQWGVQTVRVIVDAQRGELFCLDWIHRMGQWSPSEIAIQARSTWLEQSGREQIVTGPAAARWQPESLPDGCRLAPQELWTPSASSMCGFLKWLGSNRPPVDTAITLLPEYGRLSAAEENRIQRI